ncbi:MAG: hypothetical protein AAF789_04330 [Bacteroidota bacterium]
MKDIHPFIFLFFLVLSSSCQNKKQVTADQANLTLGEILGDDHKVDTLGKYVLATALRSNDWVEFVVISTKNGMPEYGPEKCNGKVNWHDEGILKVIERPEVIEDKQSSGQPVRYIDVKSKKKINNPKEEL